MSDKKELPAEVFLDSQPPMKIISDETAFLEASKPLMRYLCENHHPHVTVIINGTGAELLEGLKIVNCNDYVTD